MKTLLFICHVEPMFLMGKGTSGNREMGFTAEYMFKLGLVASKFDRVIVLNSEVDESFEWPYEQWSWGWGYEPDYCYCGKCADKIQCTIQSNGHEATYIPEEALTFPWREYKVSIAGGFDSECLEDWRAVLRHLKVEFEDVREVIYQ